MAKERARGSMSPSIALLSFARIVERELAPLLERHGLTIRKYGILGHIDRDDGVSYSELARRSGITVQSAHALIGALIDDDLVSAEEARSGAPARLTTTTAGRRRLDQVARDLQQLDAQLFAQPPLGDLSAALATAMESLARDAGSFES